MTEESVSRFINSRYCMAIIGVLSIAMSYVLLQFGCDAAIGSEGLFYTVGVLPSGTLSWLLNALMVVGAVFLVGLLDKRFAFIREYTSLYAPFFLFSTFSNPSAGVSLNAASVLCLIVAVCTAIIFNRYQQKTKRGAVFLTAAILATCGMFDYRMLFYLPVFLVGFMQMQLFSFKGFLALLVGIVFPYWIAFGFGWIAWDGLQVPDLSFSLEKVASALSVAGWIRVALAVATGTAFGIANAFHIMSYRLQLRSYNGFFNVLALATLVFMALDVSNINAYVVVLNLCVAIQAAHFFTIYKFRRRYVLFFLLLIANAACTALELLHIL